MSVIKRVWSSKKTTWNWKEQVWDKDWKLKKYDWEWRDVEWDIQVYDTQWETLSWDAELDTYDSNTPTFIWTVEDWIEAAYEFKDWDGTVLKTGSVKDGWTPVPPSDPTREPSWWYTYTFSGWNPEVWPITKSTEYIAQYEATAIEYTVSIAPNSSAFWSVDVSEVTANYGTTISTSWAELTIWETTITATPESWYHFVSWTCNGESLPATVTWNMGIVANFEVDNKTASISSNDVSMWTVDVASITAVSGTTITTSNNTLTIGSTTSTATAETGYEFVDWTLANGNALPATLTDNISIKANFQATGWLPAIYQEVEYIQNTGTQYISTWRAATSGSTSVEVDFEVLTHENNTETFIYWVWDDGWFRAWPIDNWWTTTAWFTYDPSTYALNTRTIATGTSPITTDNIAYIFWQGEWASVTHYYTGTMKLYSLVIKENNVVVRNFVPCYIKATSEAWLYDTVTETFFGNTSGNGALVAWPDVN